MCDVLVGKLKVYIFCVLYTDSYILCCSSHVVAEKVVPEHPCKLVRPAFCAPVPALSLTPGFSAVVLGRPGGPRYVQKDDDAVVAAQ